MAMQTVMLYDGQCALCQQSVRLIKPLDWRSALEYVDMQAWAEVHRRFPTLEYEALLGAIHVVRPDGCVFAGYMGVREIARRLPLTAWLYPIMGVPGIAWLGDKVYRWVAAHRYQFNRFFGGPTACEGGTCKLPPTRSKSKGQ